MQLIFRESFVLESFEVGDLSAVDLGLQAYGEIYGLWLHGGHDAEQNPSCNVISAFTGNH